LNPKKDITNDEKPYYFKIEIPYLLSFLSNRNVNSFVPGIEDLIYGNEEQNIMSAEEKMARGRVAIQTLQEYQKAKKLMILLIWQKLVRNLILILKKANIS